MPVRAIGKNPCRDNSARFTTTKKSVTGNTQSEISRRGQADCRSPLVASYFKYSDIDQEVMRGDMIAFSQIRLQARGQRTNRVSLNKLNVCLDRNGTARTEWLFS